MNPSNIAGNSDQPDTRQQPANRRVLLAAELFRGDKEVVIHHDGHDYRLRITRQNKMILTK